jgi:hypothetical protein
MDEVARIKDFQLATLFNTLYGRLSTKKIPNGNVDHAFQGVEFTPF